MSIYYHKSFHLKMEVINKWVGEVITFISILHVFQLVDVPSVQFTRAFEAFQKEIREVVVEEHLPLEEESTGVEGSDWGTEEEVKRVEPNAFTRGDVAERVDFFSVEQGQDSTGQGEDCRTVAAEDFVKTLGTAV